MHDVPSAGWDLGVELTGEDEEEITHLSRLFPIIALGQPGMPGKEYLDYTSTIMESLGLLGDGEDLTSLRPLPVRKNSPGLVQAAAGCRIRMKRRYQPQCATRLIGEFRERA